MQTSKEDHMGRTLSANESCAIAPNDHDAPKIVNGDVGGSGCDVLHNSSSSKLTSNDNDLDEEIQTENSNKRNESSDPDHVSKASSLKNNDDSQRCPSVRENSEIETKLEESEYGYLYSVAKNHSFSRKILDGIPQDAKDRHRNVLLRLLTTDYYTSKRLFSLATRCGISESFFSTRYEHQEGDGMKILMRKTSTLNVARELPCKLAKLSKEVRYKDRKVNKSAPVPCSSLNKDFVAQSCVALTLKDLELDTRQQFLNSFKLEKRIREEVQLQKAKSTEAGGSARLFSLKYNEGSLSTISKWCCGGSGQTGQKLDHSSFSYLAAKGSKSGGVGIETGKLASMQKPSASARFTKHPTIDKRFRNCSICRLWGHYEIECNELSVNDTMRFASLLKSSPLYDEHRDEVKTDNSSKQSDIQVLNEKHLDDSRQGNTSSTMTSSEGKEVRVTLETFGGFLFEQRVEPEKRNIGKSLESLCEDAVLSYDDSFIVDGFALKAATSLKELKYGEASSGTSPRKVVPRKQVTFAGDNNANCRPNRNGEFAVGDLVAWYEKVNEKDGCSDAGVRTGIVVQCSFNPTSVSGDSCDKAMTGLVCVENLTSIPSSPDPGYVESKFCKPGGSDVANPKIRESTIHDLLRCGTSTTTWIPSDDLFLVREKPSFMDAEVSGKKRKYNARKKTELSLDSSHHQEFASNAKSVSRMQKNPKVPKSRSMSYSERFKESGRVQTKDMSLAPRKPARKLPDGTYSMPQGRRPVGLDWDRTRGVWCVPNKAKAPKKTKSR